jgi:hypothetical protein
MKITYCFFFLLFLIIHTTFSQQVLYQRGGYLGIKDAITGTEITAPEYDGIKPFGKDARLFWCVMKDDKYGMLNAAGNLIIPLAYDKIEYYNSRYIQVTVSKKKGLIDYNGKLIVDFGLWSFRIFKDSEHMSFFISDKNGNVIIDTSGRIISKINYGIKDIIEDKLLVISNKKKGVCKLNGEMIIPFQYDGISSAFGSIILENKGVKGLSDTSGKLLIPVQYKNIIPLQGNRCFIVDDSNRYMLTDRMGVHQSEVKFDKGYDEKGKIIVSQNNLFGTIDAEGKIIIPCLYKSIKFSNGYFLVSNENNQFGVINEINEVVIPFQYNSLKFSDDIDHKLMIIAEKNKKCGIIDINGKEVIPFKYEGLDNIHQFVSGGLTFQGVVANKNGKKGVIDLNENIIVPFDDNKYIFSLESGKYLFSGIKEEDYFSVFTIYGESFFQNKKNNGFFYLSDNFIYSIYDRKDKASELTLFNPKEKFLMSETFSPKVKITSETLPKNYFDYFLILSKNFRYGMIGADGKILIPFEYHKLTPYKTQYFIAKKGEYEGLITRTNKVILPCQYKKINSFTETYVKITDRDNKHGLVDLSGKVTVPPFYDEIRRINDKVFAAQKDNKWGVISCNNSIIVPFLYDHISKRENYNPLVEAWFLVRKENKQGIINISLSNINAPDSMQVPLIYDELKEASDNRIIARVGTKWGLIDNHNTIILPIEYGAIKYDSYERLFDLYKDKKRGYANSAGKIFIPVEYTSISSCLNRYILKKDSSFFLTNKNGKFILESGSDEILYLANDMLRIKKDNKYGGIDTNGRILISLKYDRIGAFSKKRVVAVLNDKKGMIDNNEKIIIPFIYDDLSINDNATIVAAKGNKIGLLDSSGKELISFNYEMIKPDSRFYKVKSGGVWGVSDYDGKNIIPPQYDNIKVEIAKRNEGPIYFVQNKSLWGAVDSTGASMIPIEYGNIELLFINDSKYQFKVARDGLYGVIDKEGKQIIECKYDDITRMKEGFKYQYKLTSNHLSGIADTDGKQIIECKYNEIDVIRANGTYYYKVANNNLFGIVNIYGKQIIECKYDELTLVEGCYIVKEWENIGLLDLTGKEVVPLKYKAIKTDKDDKNRLIFKLYEKKDSKQFKIFTPEIKTGESKKK